MALNFRTLHGELLQLRGAFAESLESGEVPFGLQEWPEGIIVVELEALQSWSVGHECSPVAIFVLLPVWCRHDTKLPKRCKRAYERINSAGIGRIVWYFVVERLQGQLSPERLSHKKFMCWHRSKCKCSRRAKARVVGRIAPA